MDADKLVRRTGYAAVFAVASVAGLLSYWHAVTVVGKHGQPGVYGHLYPATIDGLLVAASMVLLDAARNHEKPHWLAWVLAIGGTLMTLGANVLDGVQFGFLGSVIAAWPALALVGAYELIMILIRNTARRKTTVQPAETLVTPGGRVHPVNPVAAAPAVPPQWTETRQQYVPVITAPTESDPSVTGAHQLLGNGRPNTIARLDHKPQSDEKAALRTTGTFTAVK